LIHRSLNRTIGELGCEGFEGGCEGTGEEEGNGLGYGFEWRDWGWTGCGGRNG